MKHDVWLLRHGDAVPHGSQPDFDRALTERGEGEARAAGRALARMGVEPVACYSSPKVRARDTAALACESLGVRPQLVDAIAGDFDRDDLRDLLAGHEEGPLLLVGHEPDLSRLVGDLTGATVEFRKGGVAAVHTDGRGGRLVALLQPAHLAAVSG